MIKHKEALTVTKGMNDESVRYTHPSHGMIRVSRVSGREMQHHASEAGVNTAIELHISTGQTDQHLGSNWYMGKQVITSISMTPVQYAELISNPNTEGVPCTLKYTERFGHIEYNPIPTEVDYTREKINKLASDLPNKLKDDRTRATEILTQKGAMKKADKEELLKIIQQMIVEVSSELPFYLDQIDEHLERRLIESKAEAEALVSHVHAKLGKLAVEQPEKLQFLLEDK